MGTQITLQAIRSQLVSDGRMGMALNQLRAFLATVDIPLDISTLNEIESDYQLMKDFALRGYRDPRQNELLNQLLLRLYKLTIDIDRQIAIHKDSLFSLAAAHASKISLQPEKVREHLENFVQEQAMLSLSTNDTDAILFKLHQQEMHGFFSAIIVAPAWNDDYQNAYSEILLSPTVETHDQLLLLSALTLAVMNFPDVVKWKTLVHVYLHSTNETVRQRAFVGWALSVGLFPQTLFLEVNDILDELSGNDSHLSEELLKLQQQVIHCMNADADHQTIQRDIMPNLLKDSHLRIARFGIEELDDTMEDILHPEVSDQAVEEVEANMKRMLDMQRQGADIYFGGFSQMKRFPFFSTLSNWFQPFYTEHPQLNNILGDRGNEILQMLFRHGPFCDSDKYSFAIALSQVIHRLPKEMQEMMEAAEVSGMTDAAEDLHSAACLRRMYLQDLYRFFRLHPQRASFYNPFDFSQSNGIQPHALVILNFPNSILQRIAIPFALFLLKISRRQISFIPYSELALRVMMKANTADMEAQLLLGRIYLLLDKAEEAAASYGFVLQEDADNQQALRGFARSSFLLGRFNEAAEAYAHLNTTDAHLSYCIAMVEAGRALEVKNELFRLHFEHETDLHITRALAWALIKLSQPADAWPLCKQLLSEDAPQPDDLLNAAYCQWAMRNVSNAVDLFMQYKKCLPEGHTLYDKLEADRKTLLEIGISASEIKVVSDIVDG